jgi:pyruvate kinase
MMLNQSNLSVESKPAERRLTSSHATNAIPAAWPAPMPARKYFVPPTMNAGTASPLPAGHQSEKNAPQNRSRKTKIIATLGPASDSSDVLRSLMTAGVCVFRLNLACISREAALKVVFGIRAISAELHRPVSLLLDTQVSPAPAADSPAISESDWADIRLGLECGVDWLAVSAGHNGDAVRQLRQFLVGQKRGSLGILARIKDPAPLATLDQIIQDADGIILDGGNLADERLAGNVSTAWPLIWQQIVQNCVRARKLAVIATDVNADMAATLFSKPDALLLTQETSAGSNPLQSVRTLDRLIRQEESRDGRDTPITVPLATEADQVVASAVQQAGELPAEAMILLTRTEHSAALGAALRPVHARVFVFTPDARLARRLRLRYALETVVMPFSDRPKANLRDAGKLLLERRLLSPGAKVVWLCDPLNQEPLTSSVSVSELAWRVRSPKAGCKPALRSVGILCEV